MERTGACEALVRSILVVEVFEFIAMSVQPRCVRRSSLTALAKRSGREMSSLPG
jgi:hypothetical protein